MFVSIPAAVFTGALGSCIVFGLCRPPYVPDPNQQPKYNKQPILQNLRESVSETENLKEQMLSGTFLRGNRIFFPPPQRLPSFLAPSASAPRPSASSSRCRRTYCFSAWRSLGLAKGRGRGGGGGSSGHQIGFKSFFRSPQEAGKEAHNFSPATVEEITDGSSGAGDLLIACGGSVVTHRGRNDHQLFSFVIIKC